MAPSTTFRKDIEGLRALAVLVIVLFHMGVETLAGGFIGVDIFFVISGYLITGLILKDIAAQRFSFRDFYMRRLRRLAPSLLVTLFGTLIAGFLWLGPEQFERLGKSTVAAIFSVSNIFFWNEAGYFDEDAINKPLLHLWSLAVEEQFYLVWPAVLLLLARLKTHNAPLIGLLVLSILSLSASEWMLSTDAAGAFFLTPFRIAEFGLGAGVAIFGSIPNNRPRLANTISATGLIFVIVSVFTYTETMRFPGVAALVPCVGTAMLIAAGSQTWVNRGFGLYPLRYVGRASYSIYLVHWPIVVFYTYLYDAPETFTAIAGLSLAALILGACLYHLVETPFRIRRTDSFLITGRVLRWSCGTLALLTLMIASHAAMNKGYTWRIAEPVKELSKSRREGGIARRLSIRQKTCHLTRYTTKTYFDDFESCMQSQADDLIVVIGDSHAADIWAAFDSDKVVQLTGTGCSWAIRSKMCDSLRLFTLEWLQKNQDRIRVIVYTQRGEKLIADSPDAFQGVSFHQDMIETLWTSLSEINTDKVPLIIVGPRPEFHPKVAVMLARSNTMHDFHRRMQRVDTSDFGALDTFLKGSVPLPNTQYYSLYDIQCPDGRCAYTYGDGKLIFVDYGHWSPGGGTYMLEQLKKSHPELHRLLTP